MSSTHVCERCNVPTKKYDKVKRCFLGKFRKKHLIKIDRYRCPNCGRINRELPAFLEPFKHYHKNIIDAVRSNRISDSDPDWEDYPNIQTMERWKKAG